MLNLVRADKLGYALGCGVKHGWAHSSEAKLIRVRKEAYLKSHPRNTLSSHSGIDGAPQSLQRNRRSGHTVTRGCHAVSANDAGRAAPVTPS